MRIFIVRLLLFSAIAATAGAVTANSDRLPFSNSIKAVPELQANEQPGRRPVITRRTLRGDELSAPMTFEVALRMRNFAELQARIARGELIAPSEMAARYYPLAEDYARTVAWIRTQGLSVSRTDDNRLAVFGRGSVDAVARAFQTQFARVNANGAEYTSAIAAPSLPADVAPAVLGIHGLQPHIRLHRMVSSPPNAEATSSYYPSQIATAYNASSTGLTGSGQVIAIYDNAFPATTDLTAFWSATGVAGSLANVQFVNVNGGPSTQDALSLEEATLDVEWSSGMAPGAVIRVYGSDLNDPASFDETFQQVYADLQSQPGLRQLSISYGLGESDFDSDYLVVEAQYMANLTSAGVTVLAASGDTGAYANGAGTALQPSYPASDPSVTGVGGTTVTVNSNSTVTSETAWSGSGGGISTHFLRPAWQTGTGVSSGNMRLTPDVAAPGDPNTGAKIILSGQPSVIGGTSWSTPVWAAFCAMINQSRSAAGQPPLGLLNPRIYPLLGTSAFRDITSGGNGVYRAAAGYDLCTGAGVPNVANLILALGKGNTAPEITDQMGNQAVTVGQIATFAVAAVGTTPLGYQWQRLPWGSQSWVNLTDGGTYGGSTTADLAVSSANYAMDGDQFRCVVSNALGSATSASEYLNVDPVGVTTLAGWPDAFGSADGIGRMARFNYPGSIRMDLAGNAYVADAGNDTIRKVTPQGVVTTVAGTPGLAGSTNGPASGALFNTPAGVAVDSSGNVYVADNGNFEIREISASGTVSTLAGLAGVQGTTDGTGTSARFYDPQNLALDGKGNLYVVDGGANTLRQIVLATGAVTTLAGSPNVSGTADGTKGSARFNLPVGVGTDSSGNIYVADAGNNTIRKVTPAGAVTTLAGLAGTTGSANGTGSAARFNFPTGIAVDSAGDIFVTDQNNYTIREISPSLAVTTIAGAAGVAEGIDGLAANARFYTPADLALDSAGILYIADQGNNTVRRLVLGSLSAPTGTVTSPPPSSPLAAGSALTMSVNVPTVATTIQWQLNGVAIPGAMGSTYAIGAAGTVDAGTYTVLASNAAGTITLSVGTLQVTTNSHLYNISSRAYVGTGLYQNLVAGFFTDGAGSKNIVVRGIGPNLAIVAPSLVGLTLPNPKLTLYNGSAAVLATNTAWGGGQTLTNAFASVYATPLQPNSNDTAAFIGVPAGAGIGYTAQVDGLNGGSGVALVEVYDYDSYVGTPASRLINISSRAVVGTGNQSLVAGFYVIGNTAQTLLIRAVGPGLAATPALNGLTLARPTLTLFDSKGNTIATNVGWGNSPAPGNSTVVAGIEPATTAIMNKVYASTIAAGSADCAMVVTLPTGGSAAGYTAQVSSADSTTGIALIEVYNIP